MKNEISQILKLIEVGNLDKALQEVKILYSKNHENLDIAKLLAYTYTQLGLFDKVIEVLEKGFKSKPNKQDFDYFNNIGYALAETEEYEKYKGKVSMILTSPPYYAKEEYSDDLEQSYIQFRSYKDWITMYLYTTFKIGYEMVKDGGYCLVNISDITIKSKHFELELDTIQTLEEIGWEYQYQIGMRMNRFIGLDAGKIVNRVMDKSKGNFMKVEPILVFKK